MQSELAFRAQLILREQREIYDYWRRCARGRSMPARCDIDPVAIPHLLAGLSILDADAGPESVRYRLAGTRVRQIYGVEVTGRALFEIHVRKKQEYWRSVYTSVITGKLPMQGAIRGPIDDRDHLILFWLRLPLSNDSGDVDKILGYDAALPSTLALSGHDGSEAVSGNTRRKA